MFGRFNFLYKSLTNVTIDSNKSHLYLKGTKLPLILLRPQDIVDLGELVGSGSEDILLWIGKTIGKAFCKAVQEKDKPSTRQKLIHAVMNYLQDFGYGMVNIDKYVEGKEVLISVKDPLEKNVEGGQVITLLYNGILSGIFNESGLEVEGTQIKSVSKGDEFDAYQFIFEEAGK